MELVINTLIAAAATDTKQQTAKMVQGTSYDYNTKVSTTSTASWEKASAKRSGYEAVQRADKERQQQKQAAAEASKYGAWGSTFKGRDHFASMHHC